MPSGNVLAVAAIVAALYYGGLEVAHGAKKVAVKTKHAIAAAVHKARHPHAEPEGATR